MYRNKNPYANHQQYNEQTNSTNANTFYQQQQQNQYLDEINSYSKPPASNFSSNYMNNQNSHHSFQEYAQSQITGNDINNTTGKNISLNPGVFQDVPSLTLPSNINYGFLQQQQQQQQQQQFSSSPLQQPPILGSIYKHNNNSNSLVQNTTGLSHQHDSPIQGIPQPRQSFSPSQYSSESDYNSIGLGQTNTNNNLSNTSNNNSNFGTSNSNDHSGASSPFHQPHYEHSDSVSQRSAAISFTNLPQPGDSNNNIGNVSPVLSQSYQQSTFNNNYNNTNTTTTTTNNNNNNVNNVNINDNNSNVNNVTGNNYMYFERRPDLLTKSTQDKAAVVKLKIENFYQQSVKYAIERNERRVELETELASHDWSEERKSRQLASLGKKESQFLRLRRTRLSLEDFQTVKVIGKGAFGEVRLVQKKDTGKVYAMKTLLKSEMYKKDQLAHVKAERDVLAGSDSPWVVSLYYSFQDAQYLYLIMEFLPGGDLMTMLIRWQLFTEDVTRFYMAECILAIETIHKLGFIHRDIKPDNILIDIRGHIKLSDFGLSTGFHKTHDSNYYKKLLQEDDAGNANNVNNGFNKPGQNNNTKRQTMMVDSINLTMSNRQQIQTWRKSRRLMAYSTVGTPDYIAPEIFLYQGYGQECDWWSLGAIMYECLIGWPPFCSETPQETYRKIMNFEQTLQFPDDIHISYEAEDLIRRLLTHADQRLGRHSGADEIKAHPFFRGVDWNTIRQVEAPYIPKLSSITDTRFFPIDELENVPDSPAMAQAAKQREQMMKQGGSGLNNGAAIKEDLPFIGYTYSRFDYLTRKNAL
ncbi:serine/threonine protein kinase CBK1 PWA37_003309 [Arxiozyma heterogenica]|uniref:serine/threonine protein kinase CBK1 n=1 Tax=Arxiozyma heterogenica TaxID=278026 RepID=UPI002EE655F9